MLRARSGFWQCACGAGGRASSRGIRQVLASDGRRRGLPAGTRRGSNAHHRVPTHSAVQQDSGLAGTTVSGRLGRVDSHHVKRFLAGHRAAERHADATRALGGPNPAQAIAESLSALNAACEMGIWPGPRDPISEQAVQSVRRRWARVGQRTRRPR